MIKNKFLISLPLLFLFSCSHLQREQRVPITIEKDDLGTRWTDVPIKTAAPKELCIARILSFQQAHLRLALQTANPNSEHCEFGSPEIIKAITPATKSLMSSYPGPNPDKINIDLTISQSPSLLTKWALFLKNSKKWQNRKKQKNSWDNSEYGLIKELLAESKIFDVYNPIFQLFPEHTKQTLYIEKVAYYTAHETPIYEKNLKPAGYFPQERIPTPLMITLILSK